MSWGQNRPVLAPIVFWDNQSRAKAVSEDKFREAQITSSAANALGAHGAQIRDAPVGLMHLQIFHGVITSGDGQHFRADGSGAFDIARRVTDDEDFFALQSAPEQSAAVTAGAQRHFVPLSVFIAVSAEGEVFPQIVTAQLQFGAGADVAGEQSEQRRRA